jgi:hypothetical protein
MKMWHLIMAPIKQNNIIMNVSHFLAVFDYDPGIFFSDNNTSDHCSTSYISSFTLPHGEDHTGKITPT